MMEYISTALQTTPSKIICCHYSPAEIPDHRLNIMFLKSQQKKKEKKVFINDTFSKRKSKKGNGVIIIPYLNNS